MKTGATFSSVLAAICIAFSSGCSGGDQGGSVQPIADSMKVADSLAAQPLLENLLGIADEATLIRLYGKERVKYDTIWGAEGFFSMGTILKTEPESHIEITWINDSLKTDVVSVTQVSDTDWYADTLARGQWKSITGVEVGMTIDKLQKINGRVFRFSGFGWDYAGGVISWQGGTLEGKGIAVQLSEGPAPDSMKMSEAESAQIFGDVEVQSDNPLLKPFAPRVWSISVATVK